MATILEVRSDIESRIFDGPKTDESHITRELILMRMNEYRAALFRKANPVAAVMDIGPDWLTRLECIVVSQPESDCSCGICTDFAFDLPSSVFNLPEDAGMVLVKPCGGKEFRRTTPAQFPLTSKMRFGKPSETNSFFYRIGNKVWLKAGGRLLDKCKFEVWAALDGPIDVGCGLAVESTTQFPMPNDFIAPLCEAVAASFLGELQVPQDTANDGKEKGTNKPI